MVQVKKPGVRDAIVASAAALFADRGFQATTVTKIAHDAGIGVGNIYSYFPSKLHILYEVYRPWLAARLDTLEAELGASRDARAGLRLILWTLWQEIPERDPWLATSLMEALATADPEGGTPDRLLVDTKQRLSALLRAALPARRHHLLRDDLLANLCLMAFDGFVLNRRLQDRRDVAATIDLVTGLLLGDEAAVAPAQVNRSSKTA